MKRGLGLRYKRIWLVGVVLAVLIAPRASNAAQTHSPGSVEMSKDEQEAHLKPFFEAVVDAIYLAEGGTKAKKPYGILSVPCGDKAECRRICYNTVRNNYRRWDQAGRPGEYIEFLQKRYAPTKGATNDPTGLNHNWRRNVEALMWR